MAALEGTLDLGNLAQHYGVDRIQATVLSGGNKFLVWTRLSNENSSWIINVSDGNDVWRTELDKEQLETHRELAEIDKYDIYFEKFRSEFLLYNLSLVPFANKMSLTVGLELPSLTYDLFEAKASEKRTEMQLLMFRLADTVTELTAKLKVSEEALERLKSQKDSAPVGASVFEPPSKKPAVATVKRKQGHSLINPGSRNDEENVMVQMEGTVPSDGSSVHMSVLSGGRTLDIYKCTDFNCSFGCLNSSKRYHCPLCDNKPQKPGRMRRHFIKMHSGKQLVQHEGYQMLRCKLRCSRSNGRVAENSHYHCCLCGRVCLRKVHLFCHLQAHSLGMQHEIDEEMMDADKDEDELDETDVVEDEEDIAQSSTLESSQMEALASTQSENVVALTDGTQVVYVQSIQDGDTLTVMPLEGQTGELQLSQHQAATAATSAADLSTQLQILTSVAGSSTMPDIGAADLHQGLGIPQDSSALVKQVEAMLNQGEQSVTLPQGTSAESVLTHQDSVSTLEVFAPGEAMSNIPPSIPGESMPNVQSAAPQSQGLEDSSKEATDLREGPQGNQEDGDAEEPMEFETSLSNIRVTQDGTPSFSQVNLDATSAQLAENKGDNVVPSVEGVQDETADQQVAGAQFEAPATMPTSHIGNQMETTTSNAVSNQVVPPTPIASVNSENQLVSCLQLQSTTAVTPTCVTAAVAQNSATVTVTASTRTTPAKPISRKPKASEQDSLILVEPSKTPEEDDKIFQLLGWKDQPRKDSFFKHVSIMTDTKNTLDTKRCRNTDCDCRLYHCPLCTCLPNKPGRIKEHFKKIHSTNFIIRYQGTRMLRCKLGCCRPSGKKVMNSHYHCCLCGTICMRKAAVYEHMRVQHVECGNKPGPGRPPMVPNRPGKSSQAASQGQLLNEQTPKATTSESVQVPAAKPVVVQIPSFAQGTQEMETTINTAPQAQVQMMAATQGSQQQAVTLQIPQTGDASQVGQQQQQQLVILMPQQLQGTATAQSVQAAPQPIVILMPQTGGQAAQPVVVPVPQVSAM